MSGLFERLRAPACSGRSVPRLAQGTDTVEMIKRHLETLLNTRQGCSQSSPDLGLRDFNGHDASTGDLLQQVSEDIRRTIRRFEPRIEVRALRAMPETSAPLELHFQLDCQVRVNNHTEQLLLELLVNGHNRYTRVR